MPVGCYKQKSAIKEGVILNEVELLQHIIYTSKKVGTGVEVRK